MSQSTDTGCTHLHTVYYTHVHRVRVKKAVGGDSAADTLESLETNNTPLTQREMGVHCFHVAHSWKGEETCVCVWDKVLSTLKQPNTQVSQEKEGVTRKKKQWNNVADPKAGTSEDDVSPSQRLHPNTNPTYLYWYLTGNVTPRSKSFSRIVSFTFNMLWLFKEWPGILGNIYTQKLFIFLQRVSQENWYHS